MPEAPTPAPEEEGTKKKAKIKAKKASKVAAKKGTTQLQVKKKPTAGGLQGIKTSQGVNTGTSGGGGGTYGG
jgi:hypothetical protein